MIDPATCRSLRPLSRRRLGMGPSLSAAVAASVALGATASTLLADCPPSDHGCFAVGGPGCTDLACCEAVCGQDPFCCEATWDFACLTKAFTLCEVPPCDLTCPPGALDEGEPCGSNTNGGCNVPVLGDSTCCAPHGTPGCDEFDCEFAVCQNASFCCEFEWDSYCVSLAVDLCPTVCSLGEPSFTPIACGQSVCATSWADEGQQDSDWFQFTIDSTREVTISIATAMPMKIGLVDNDGTPDCGLPQTQSPTASADYCSEASFTACLAPGTYWIIAAPTLFSGFPCGGEANGYVLSLACGGACIPPACGAASTGDCFEASGSPYCNDESCCNDVCAINPWCCDVAWDESCVGSAKTYCVTCDLVAPPGTVAEAEACGEDTNGGCNLPVLGTSSCCGANEVPGCDDPVCQAAVCSFDAFCCEVVWDAICGSYAWTLCPDACPLGEPSFEPIACGMSIQGTAWAEDGYKDTDWYELTVDELTTITFSGTAQFPLLLGVADTGGYPDCNPGTGYQQLNPYVLAYPCTEATLTTCLEPGTWYLFVAPQDTFGWPCAEPDCHCPDLNGSGGVDAADLAILLGAWGATDSCANLNGSGTVDAADLGVLLGAWGPYTCSSSGTNGYVVTLECAEPACTGPANDFCATAAPIGLGTTEFSSIGATSGGPLLPISCDEGFGTVMVRDIWFTFTAPSSGVLTVSTCNEAFFDTRLAAYEGTCSNLSIVACNDDSPDCFQLTSIMQFFVNQGTTYRIRLGSYADPGVGSITLTLE